MPRTTVDDEDWEGDDFGGGDDDETIPCPHCKKHIYEGAEQCPHCGMYVSEEDVPREAKPAWIIIGGVVCLVMVILWVWKG
jgi:hypothetical protein